MKITSASMDITPDPRIQKLPANWFRPFVQQAAILRLDEVHPVVSGNKWYKLKYNIAHALSEGCKTIVTFGGGYSNHLVATAAAADASGLNSVGVVRGKYDVLTPTLLSCIDYGMQLEFISQDEYKQKDNELWLARLSVKYNNAFIVPEGGANSWGRQGAAEIAYFIPETFSHVCISAGTGTTMEGLRNALPGAQKLFGYVPMKGGSYLRESISQHVADQDNWKLFDDWHFGGFGKCSEGLIAFMNQFYCANNIPLDMVYTAKMMYGVHEQMKAGVFDPDARIICIHTGGLQGNASISSQLIY